MDTTKLIVEYLVAGTLIVVATLSAATSWFPVEMSALLVVPGQQQSTLANQVILTSIFLASAYAVGIISEYAGERAFEWLLNRTKRKRMAEYAETYGAILKHSPIFGPFIQQPKEQRDANGLADAIGKMRFVVLNQSAPLYSDIAAQINRFRVIRVLFLVEVILLVTIVGQLRYGFTLFWFLAFVLVVSVAALNFVAIRSRFNRYCRAVERSYLVLMYAQAEQPSQSAKT